MEGWADRKSFLCACANITGLFNPLFLEEMGKNAIVRTNKIVPLTGSGKKPSVAANPGINHHQMDAARWKEVIGVVEAAGCCSDITGWNSMVEINRQDAPARL